MTEKEWFACQNPEKMLDFMKEKVSDRKLRLFAVACCYICRRGEVNSRLEEDYEAVVAFVDGVGTLEDVRRRWLPSSLNDDDTWPEQSFVWAREFASTAARTVAERNGSNTNFPTAAEAIPLIHEIFSNPFRPVKFSMAWRTDTALSLAKQMYESRDFSLMPILGDALQDADCNNEDVLNHCRDANATHVRGCWVIDLVLGKV